MTKYWFYKSYQKDYTCKFWMMNMVRMELCRAVEATTSIILVTEWISIISVWDFFHMRLLASHNWGLTTTNYFSWHLEPSFQLQALPLKYTVIIKFVMYFIIPSYVRMMFWTRMELKFVDTLPLVCLYLPY